MDSAVMDFMYVHMYGHMIVAWRLAPPPVADTRLANNGLKLSAGGKRWRFPSRLLTSRRTSVHVRRTQQQPSRQKSRQLTLANRTSVTPVRTPRLTDD